MTLTDAQVERYSRQIVLPEVGGRGQERLLGARVAVAGGGDVAAAVSDLLARAGVGVVDVHEPIPDVIVDLSGDAVLGRRAQAMGRPVVLCTLAGTRVTVTTLVGRQCVTCLPAPEPTAAVSAGALAAPAVLALAALAASEALRVLLLPPASGRRTALDVATGVASAAELAATDGCTLCAGSA